jgi:hypothetical protein
MASHVGDAVAEAPTDIGREQCIGSRRISGLGGRLDRTSVTGAARDCAMSPGKRLDCSWQPHHAITARGGLRDVASCGLAVSRRERGALSLYSLSPRYPSRPAPSLTARVALSAEPSLRTPCRGGTARPQGWRQPQRGANGSPFSFRF